MNMLDHRAIGHSVIVARFGTLWGWLLTQVEESFTTTVLERVRTGALIPRSLVENTRWLRWSTTIVRQMELAWRHSLLSSLIESFRWLLEASWFYGWVTTEPESHVIVITLRETYTVRFACTVLGWVTDDSTMNGTEETIDSVESPENSGEQESRGEDK
jgi:hypothetical protein